MAFGIVMTDNVVNNKILNIPNLVMGTLNQINKLEEQYKRLIVSKTFAKRF